MSTTCPMTGSSYQGKYSVFTIQRTRILYLIFSRNEKTQVEALMDYYMENDGSDKQVLMKVCQIVGQWGIPVVFLVFATVYWTMGMAKYYSG